MIFCAVLMTLYSAFLSATEQSAYHAMRQYVRMLFIVEWQKATSSFDRLFFPQDSNELQALMSLLDSSCVNGRPGEVVLNVCSQEYKDVYFFHTVSIFDDGRGSALHFLKLMKTSYVFFVLSVRLVAKHNIGSLQTFSLQEDLSLPEMTLTPAVSSANFIMELVQEEEAVCYDIPANSVNHNKTF